MLRNEKTTLEQEILAKNLRIVEIDRRINELVGQFSTNFCSKISFIFQPIWLKFCLVTKDTRDKLWSKNLTDGIIYEKVTELYVSWVKCYGAYCKGWC